MGKMYENVRTWNPFVGCYHNCVYCKPSFQRQAKRRRKWCSLCYSYKPHFHLERLEKIPKARVIFACAYGDVAFAFDRNPPLFDSMSKIIGTIKHQEDKEFYIQTKWSQIYSMWLDAGIEIPHNLILGITLESDRDIYSVPSYYRKYSEISGAQSPAIRAMTFAEIDVPRKYVTIEPILDFSKNIISIVRKIKPEFVYVGYDNHNCRLPEPPLEKTLKLVEELERFTEVRLKTIRRSWYESA